MAAGETLVCGRFVIFPALFSPDPVFVIPGVGAAEDAEQNHNYDGSFRDDPECFPFLVAVHQMKNHANDDGQGYPHKGLSLF